MDQDSRVQCNYTPGRSLSAPLLFPSGLPSLAVSSMHMGVDRVPRLSGVSADPVVANHEVARHCWVRCIPSHIGFGIRGAGDIPKGGSLVSYLEKD